MDQFSYLVKIGIQRNRIQIRVEKIVATYLNTSDGVSYQGGTRGKFFRSGPYRDFDISVRFLRPCHKTAYSESNVIVEPTLIYHEYFSAVHLFLLLVIHEHRKMIKIKISWQGLIGSGDIECENVTPKAHIPQKKTT